MLKRTIHSGKQLQQNTQDETLGGGMPLQNVLYHKDSTIIGTREMLQEHQTGEVEHIQGEHFQLQGQGNCYRPESLEEGTKNVTLLPIRGIPARGKMLAERIKAQLIESPELRAIAQVRSRVKGISTMNVDKSHGEGMTSPKEEEEGRQKCKIIHAFREDLMMST